MGVGFHWHGGSTWVFEYSGLLGSGEIPTGQGAEEPGAKAGLQGDGTRRDRMGSEGYAGARLQLSPSPSRQQGCVLFVLLDHSLSCLGENCLSCACGFHLVWRCSTVIIRYRTAQFLSPHGIGCIYIRGVPEPVISVMVFLIPLLYEN